MTITQQTGRLLAVEPLAGASLVGVTATLGATALLTLLMGWLGRAEKLRPNQLFGIRTSRTLSDDELWYRVHRKSAGWAFGAGGAALAGVVAVPLLSSGTAQAAVVVSTLSGYVVLIGLGAWLAQRNA